MSAPNPWSQVRGQTWTVNGWEEPPVLDSGPSGRGMSELESVALNRIERAGLPIPVREHYFARPRRWRFDFAYLDGMIAIECEGGTWSKGRHTTGKGFDGDCRKYGEAVARGWRVLRCTRAMVEDGTMVELLGRMLT